MDLDKIKQRLKNFQDQAAQRTTFLWKPPAGKTQIRIVPYKFNKDVQFTELYFYFNLFGKKPILSPTSYGEADPIVEFANKLKNAGGKDDYILGRKLEPRPRIFTPIVVRTLENEGIKFWGFGTTVYTDLLAYLADDDYGDISHPTTGRDIVVESITPQEAGNKYGKVSIRVKPKVEPLSKNSDELKALLEDQKNISELYKKHTYDELNDMLKNYLQPEDGATEETKEASDSESEKGTDAKAKQADTAFKELFDKD